MADENGLEETGNPSELMVRINGKRSKESENAMSPKEMSQSSELENSLHSATAGVELGSEPTVVTNSSIRPKIPKDCIASRKSRSACRSRSRDPKQCQAHFQKMICKHESRNDELEQQEVDQRKRLDILECSMPAVMVWNILKATEGAPMCTVRRLIQKQMEEICALEKSGSVPSSPSKHFDHRVREIEAERKEALNRAEEARAVLRKKEAAIEKRTKLLEEARKCNEEKKKKIDELLRKAAQLKEEKKNAMDEKSCESGECGRIGCKDTMLKHISSIDSIHSRDLECLAKLQDLAETEICMKREIENLEHREETFMRALQQADELWSKMEGDSGNASVGELQELLDLKTSANQQLADRICQLEDQQEQLKKQLAACNDELGIVHGVERVDAQSGLNDAEANVVESGIVAKVDTVVTAMEAVPDMIDSEISVRPEVFDKESSFAPEISEDGVSARVTMIDQDSEAIVGQMERGIDRPSELRLDASVGDAPVLGAYHSATETMTQPESPDENPEDDKEISDKWKDHNWDDGCPSDIICDDMVESSTVTDAVDEQIPIPTSESLIQATAPMTEQMVGGEGPEDMAEIVRVISIPASDDRIPASTPFAETKPDPDQVVLSREELRNWYNIVDSIHHTISKCDNCSSKITATEQLAKKMRDQLRMESIVGGKTSLIGDKMVQSSREIDKIPASIIGDSGDDSNEYRTSSPRPPVQVTTKIDDSHTPIGRTSELSLREGGPVIEKVSDGFEEFPEIVSKIPEGEISARISSDEFLQEKLSKVSEPLAHDSDRSSLASYVSAREGLAEDLALENSQALLSGQKAQVSEPLDAVADDQVKEDSPDEPAVEEVEKIDDSSGSLIIQAVPPEESKIEESMSEHILRADSRPKSIEEVGLSESKIEPIEEASIETIESSSIEVLDSTGITIDDAEKQSLTFEPEVEVDKGVVPQELTIEGISESEPIETPPPTTTEDQVKLDPSTERTDALLEKVPEEQHVDEELLKITSDEKIAKEPVPPEMPSSSGPKVCFPEKYKAPRPVDVCLCNPPIWPAARKQMGQETDGTQTTPLIPRTINRAILRIMTEGAWRSEDASMRRRPFIRSRSRKDKSTMTTTSINTQTKNGNVHQERRQEGVEKNVESRGMSIHDTEKSNIKDADEIMLAARDRQTSEQRRSITPKSSETSYLGLESPKGASMEKTAPPSQADGKKERKESETFEKPKIRDGTRRRREIETSSRGKSRIGESCCPCPSAVEEKTVSARSKPSGKRRKPEKKDQSVLAKPSRKGKQIQEAAGTRFKDGGSAITVDDKTRGLSNECCFAMLQANSKPALSLTKGESTATMSRGAARKMQTALGAEETLKCPCAENGSVHVPYINYSSIFKANIGKPENTCDCEIDALPKGK